MPVASAVTPRAWAFVCGVARKSTEGLGRLVNGHRASTGVMGGLLACALLVGCGTASQRDVAAAPGGTWLGLTDCGSGNPVAAMWASDKAGAPRGNEPGSTPGADIWTVTADGRYQPLTDDMRSMDPSLSDDGRRLYFTRSPAGFADDGPPGGTELWVADLETGKQSMLYQTAAWNMNVIRPSESPDGTQVAFSAATGTPEDPNQHILILDLADHAHIKELPFPADEALPYQSEIDPAWSPDGSKLAYIDDVSAEASDAQARLRILDLIDGSDRSLYSSKVDTRLSGLRWSPDGSQLVVRENDDDPATRGWALVAIDTATADRRVIAEQVMESIAFVSADGETLASVGLSAEQVYEMESPKTPSLTTFRSGQVTTDKVPDNLTFASELTIASCAMIGA